MNYKKVKPEIVADYVNFSFDDKENSWKYDPNGVVNIAKLQAEGSAKIWNILLEEKIALLADEVGTGKTYQALATMATLWRQNPTAKVLLFAPNENVAKKWIKEYNYFINNNYRICDNLVKSAVSNAPLRSAIYCHNFIDLIKSVNLKWPSFFVCKTSSLSGFLSPKMSYENLKELGIEIDTPEPQINTENRDLEKEAEWMHKVGVAINKYFYKLLSGNDSEPPFEMLIFDESHYLRRSEGKSNRSIVAHSFFSRRNIRQEGEEKWEVQYPIARMTQLLTATPNHSSAKDISNVVSLFNSEFRNAEPDDILKRICVRRYRRLNSFTKHEYRSEEPKGVQMTSIQEKLFFALYQKCLVANRAKLSESNNGKRQNPYAILFGYLEGFEFLASGNQEDSEDSGLNKDTSSGSSGDFRKLEDSEIIKEISEKFNEAYKEPPKHPKYEETIRGLAPNNDLSEQIDKKLVFVRRIPSSRELTARIIQEYDKLYISLLEDIISAEAINKPNFRSYFTKIVKQDISEEETELITDSDNNEDNNSSDDGIPKSKILDLFTIKKKSKIERTDCSNFRIRFLRNEQVFSIFFEPPVENHDYKYHLNKIYQSEVKSSGKRRSIFQTTVQVYRSDKIAKSPSGISLKLNLDYDEKLYVHKNVSYDTLLGIWIRKIKLSCSEKVLYKNALREYCNFSVPEKEGFSKYIAKGILFASHYIIYFYSIFKKLTKKDSDRGDNLYQLFCEKIEKNITTCGLADFIANCVMSFKVFYQKELGLKEESLIREQWSFLNNLNPVYPYTGDTTRPSVLKAFNSPFYPNVLVATSVLQEGVDLHYQCCDVTHYGIAWTQGDNEQRIGRVDRLFGKIQSKLEKEKNASLLIEYPFLKNTIDEDQMKRFIVRKSEAEILIDQFKNINYCSEINYHERCEGEKWLELFKKPVCKSEINIIDPFPVLPENFKGIKKENPNLENNFYTFKNIVHPVLQTIDDHYKNETIICDKDGLVENSNIIAGIFHTRKNQREQPIIIKLCYYEPALNFINKPAYYLDIISPLYKAKDVNLSSFSVENKNDDLIRTYNNNPLLKVCVDLSRSRDDIFKLYVGAQLPIFMVNGSDNNLSSKELIQTINDVIAFADDLEASFREQEDEIKNKEVSLERLDFKNENTNKLGKDRIPDKKRKNWIYVDDLPHAFKKKECSFKSHLNDYEYNHKTPFVRKLTYNKKSYCQVGLYINDALEEEFYLLENVFNEANTN